MSTHANRELETMAEVFGLPQEPGPPEVRALARRAVAARARSAEDCRLLLDALGLLGREGPADGSGP
ncbi:hypothetical protein [Streptomyces rubellomurinus]|uniref:Uncharacterized protein n=1 Tax=Streptomyces rubellomurinus (strain ATCC 31215) TaxID=359131 RepID=A0A0F2T3W1_STRR3|nr:hypothetical protein [Streptomyces rubellomurinus]KJS57924.1 hypothetical protein VM95_36605 [Streptomyces rubellomurinus]